jgi:hypothetical protein
MSSADSSPKLKSITDMKRLILISGFMLVASFAKSQQIGANVWLADGKIGINKSKPDAMLDIYHPSSPASIGLQSKTEGKFWITSQINQLQIGGQGGTLPGRGAINILYDGRVAIGTNSFSSSSSSILTVNGNSTLSGNLHVTGLSAFENKTTFRNPTDFETMRVCQNGNVGIGLYKTWGDPGANLAIYGNNNAASMFLQAGNGTSGQARFWLSTSSQRLYIGHVSSDRQNKGAITIKADGKVGVGIDDPMRNLHVSNDVLLSHKDGTSLHFRTDGKNSYINNMDGFHGNASSGNENLYITGNKGILLHTGSNDVLGTARLMLLDNGFYVNNAAGKRVLSVDNHGTVVAQKIEVKNLGLPDYVFADDYYLRPLSEVESFIKTNSHLPDVPSAAYVAENGMDITDISNAMLKKIEELTLYLIEQEKKISELQQQNMLLIKAIAN